MWTTGVDNKDRRDAMQFPILMVIGLNDVLTDFLLVKLWSQIDEISDGIYNSKG